MRARSIKIIDLSVHTVATIPLGTSVLDCSKAMRALHVGSLVVINDDRQPVGMITDRDICIEVVALEKDPKGLKVEDVMSAPVCTASADETVVDALARMREQGIRRLPIMTAKVSCAALLPQTILSKKFPSSSTALFAPSSPPRPVNSL
ncbi:MAG: CBS domain-containing protein [Parasutterella excrementihominis]